MCTEIDGDVFSRCFSSLTNKTTRCAKTTRRSDFISSCPDTIRSFLSSSVIFAQDQLLVVVYRASFAYDPMSYRWLLFFVFFVVSAVSLPFPFDQYGYMMAREKIKQHDRAVQAQEKLNSREKTVNVYLEYLRAREFLETKDYFYPSRPIESEVKNITERSFYQFLSRLPKGGNLHLHEFQVLDRGVLLHSIFNSSEYDLLHICDQVSCSNSRYYLRYFQSNAPAGWTKVRGSNWTIEAILRKTTLTGILNERPNRAYATDTATRWNIAEEMGVFSSYNDLTRYNATRFTYLKLVLDQALADKVQLLELRRGFFGRTFYFAANGSRVTISAEEELDMLEEFKRDYMEKHPDLIDVVFLIYSTRISPKDQIANEIARVMSLQRRHPDLIRGYDMVGEEDQGHTLLFHSDTLIKAFNATQQTNGSLQFLFHAGETNWPQEHLPSTFGDGVSTFENIYDALVFRTHRIGHGLSLAKRPDLYEYIRQREIAIEICPASNQILGYVADLRNHPGIVYHRSGIPIVLSGDDPGSFGYNELTIEFYLATMAWGLDLADLKQLAWNSIKHSSIPEARRTTGFQKWQKQWDEFINATFSLACRQSFPGTVQVNVSDILPSYGPFDRSINVTVFGEGFQRAICKRIVCRFGSNETEAMFNDINEIICPTPKGKNALATVPLTLVIEGQSIETGWNFTYLPSVSLTDDGTLTTTPDIPLSGSGRMTIGSFLVFLCLLLSFQ